MRRPFRVAVQFDDADVRKNFALSAAADRRESEGEFVGIIHEKATVGRHGFSIAMTSIPCG